MKTKAKAGKDTKPAKKPAAPAPKKSGVVGKLAGMVKKVAGAVKKTEPPPKKPASAPKKAKTDTRNVKAAPKAEIAPAKIAPAASAPQVKPAEAKPAQVKPAVVVAGGKPAAPVGATQEAAHDTPALAKPPAANETAPASLTGTAHEHREAEFKRTALGKALTNKERSELAKKAMLAKWLKK
jgi:hypothetical protein